MRALFVSPHADDVCLSLAGTVAAVRVPKHLLTVFSRSLWAEPEWGGPRDGDEVTAARTREDELYCAMAGFAYHSLSLADSSIRLALRGDLRKPSGGEAELLPRVTAGIRRLVAEVGSDVLFGPLGLGGHTDHAVCRDAVRQAARETGATPVYYEELPYAGTLSNRAVALRAARLDPALRPLVCRTPVRVSEKLDIAEVYETQRTEAIRTAIAGHSRRVGERRASQGPSILAEDEPVAERLWYAGPAALVDELFDPRLEARLGGGLLSLISGKA